MSRVDHRPAHSAPSSLILSLDMIRDRATATCSQIILRSMLLSAVHHCVCGAIALFVQGINLYRKYFPWREKDASVRVCVLHITLVTCVCQCVYTSLYQCNQYDHDHTLQPKPVTGEGSTTYFFKQNIPRRIQLQVGRTANHVQYIFKS